MKLLYEANALRLLLVPFFTAALIAQSPQQSTASLAIRGVTVVTAARYSGPVTLITRGDRIAEIGPTGEIRIPAGTRIIDGTGKYLMPGLVDMHTHLSRTRASSLALFVVNGVTTVRDMGGDYEEIRSWRRAVVAGTRIGPRILMAGPMLESQRNIDRMRRDPPAKRVEPFERTRIGIGSPKEARAAVARLAEMEIDFLKFRTIQDRQTYLALNEAANAHGIPLIGHALPFSALAVLEAGQDGVEHGFPPEFIPRNREQRLALWRRFAAAGVPITPTLVAVDQVLEPLDHLRALVAADGGKVDPRRPYLAKFLIRDWREQLLLVSAARRQILLADRGQRLNAFREMHESGMELLIGTDAGILNVYPGSSVHDEMALFVNELGLTAAEAIDRATRRSARTLGIGDSVGTIERGKIADLVLLDGDPLRDITNTRRIKGVLLRGRYYARNDLERIRAQVLIAPDIRVDNWGRR